MLRLFRERDEVRVVDDQWGSPTYAPDLAGALLEIVRCNSEAYGVYHFTNEGIVSWYDFACEIYRMAEKTELLTKDARIRRIVTEEYPTKAHRPNNSRMLKEKIRSAFKITIRPWQDGLRDFFGSREIS